MCQRLRRVPPIERQFLLSVSRVRENEREQIVYGKKTAGSELVIATNNREIILLPLEGLN